MTEKMEWIWQKPDLNRTGQAEFWDRQSESYEKADMTVDNEMEITLAISEISCEINEEIIVLGGAIGCRDPKMILEQIFCVKNDKGCFPGERLPAVVFNDLAPKQVKRAREDILAKCHQSCGANIDFIHGPIHEVANQIVPNNRKLYLGVYGIHGFFWSDADRNYHFCGFDEYIKNRDILGDHFWFDWLVFRNGRLKTESTGLSISADASENERETFKQKLLNAYATASRMRPYNIAAIQVVSAHRGQSGFFLSHWYNHEILTDVLRIVFPSRELFTIRHKIIPKGSLFIVERRDTGVNGVITVLNNVLGNILPDEQVDTLKSIKSLM